MNPETLPESNLLRGQSPGAVPTSLDPSDVSPAEMYERFFGPAIFAPCAVLLLEHAAPRPGEAVLDLACGTGQVARRVAPLVGAGGSVTALDVSPAMLAMGRSLPTPEGAVIEWVEGDAVAPALPDDAFDLVVCQQGLQFFPDRVAALGHVCRVLRPGGQAVFATWRGLEHHPVYQAMTEAELAHLEPLGVGEDELQTPFSLEDEAELTGLLESAGLADVRIEDGTIEARFPGPDTWVRNMELAYAAVIPAFAEDRRAFDEYVHAVEAETRDIVRRHTVGDHVVVPMHARITIGTVAEERALAGGRAS